MTYHLSRYTKNTPWGGVSIRGTGDSPSKSTEVHTRASRRLFNTLSYRVQSLCRIENKDPKFREIYFTNMPLTQTVDAHFTGDHVNRRLSRELSRTYTLQLLKRYVNQAILDASVQYQTLSFTFS